MKHIQSVAMVVAAVFSLTMFPSTAGASIDVGEDTITIRDNGVDSAVKFSLEKGMLRRFKNDEECGTQTTVDEWAHHTIPGNRPFEHFHVNYTLPQIGVDENGNQWTVTLDNMKAYWDNYYSGYTSSGSEDLRHNCHGYCFGRICWIQDMTFLFEDELQSVTEWKYTKFLTNNAIHSIKVTDWQYGCLYDTIWTSEVNRGSRIYSTEWGIWSPFTATDKWKNK